jgi:hypothetical protein
MNKKKLNGILWDRRVLSVIDIREDLSFSIDREIGYKVSVMCENALIGRVGFTIWNIRLCLDECLSYKGDLKRLKLAERILGELE